MRGFEFPDLLLGSSAWCVGMRRRLPLLASQSASMLITGPAGSGRSTLARALHEHGPRSSASLVPLDCQTLPGRLFESQLLGHSAEGFLPGVGAAMGAVRVAHHGTLLLKNIEELELDNQARLCEVLNASIVLPLGADETTGVDVRVIATTELDLAEQVAAGAFNADLYLLLSSLSLGTVSLQERSEDLEALAERFLAAAARDHHRPVQRLSQSARNWMRCYPWPGNVRQLRDVIDRAANLPEDVLSFQPLRALARNTAAPLHPVQAFNRAHRFQGFGALRSESREPHRTRRPWSPPKQCRF